MERIAEIRLYDKRVADLRQDDEGFHFQYDANYVAQSDATAVSVTLPLHVEAYHSKQLFAFFDGLIPEGWMLDHAVERWKLNKRDRMSLLLNCCEDCIGAVSVHKLEDVV